MRPLPQRYRGFCVVALVEDDCEVPCTLEAWESRITAEFSELWERTSEDGGSLWFERRVEGGRIGIEVEDTTILMHLNSSPEAAEDAAWLAGQMDGLPDAARVARCQRYVLLQVQEPDSWSDYRSYFRRLIGVFRSVRGIILLDPKNPALGSAAVFEPPSPW